MQSQGYAPGKGRYSEELSAKIGAVTNSLRFPQEVWGRYIVSFGEKDKLQPKACREKQ